MKKRKQWKTVAQIHIDDTLFATIRQCDDVFCYNASKAIVIDDKQLKRVRQNDFASFDTAFNELTNWLFENYGIKPKRIFVTKM